MISVRGLTKVYGAVRAVDELTSEFVERGRQPELWRYVDGELVVATA